MKKQTKKDLEIICFQQEDLVDKMTENEKKEFVSQCSIIFNNKSFKKVCDEVGTREILYTAKEAVTTEDLAYGRGKIHGIAMIYEMFMGYDSIHKQYIEKKEGFDKNKAI